MKFMFSALLMAIAFSSFSTAQAACVPTMTVEQAKAQYDAGTKQAAQDLQQSYAVAKVICEQQIEKSQADHRQRLIEIEVRYQEEVRTVKENLDHGWREALEAATKSHNEAVQQSTNQYSAETKRFFVAYDQSAAESKTAYTTQVTKLQSQYNSAVCAGY